MSADEALENVEIPNVNLESFIDPYLVLLYHLRDNLRQSVLLKTVR